MPWYARPGTAGWSSISLCQLAKAVHICGGGPDEAAVKTALLFHMERFPRGDILNIPLDVAFRAVLGAWCEIRLGPTRGHTGWAIGTTWIPVWGNARQVFVPECRSCAIRLLPQGADGFMAKESAWEAVRHHRQCIDPFCGSCIEIERYSVAEHVILEALRIRSRDAACAGS